MRPARATRASTSRWRLVAKRVSPHNSLHCVSSDRICAVRHGADLLLSRVLTNGRALLLLPGEGESGFESLEIRDEKALDECIVGSHVLLIRR